MSRILEVDQILKGDALAEESFMAESGATADRVRMSGTATFIWDRACDMYRERRESGDKAEIVETVEPDRRSRMMTTTTERLLETARALPEPLLAEVLDFAEFLRARHAGAESVAGDRDLLDLCGGLEDSAVFHEPPEVIQRRMRDEWR
jgi:hypothetical protein